jgi:hypothetical protein
MKIIDGVEYYDEPDIYPQDFSEWEKDWCNRCKYDYKKFDSCNVVFEMAINGWSRAFKHDDNGEVVCTDFELLGES